MVNPLCTLGHANPTCPSYTIVHCRTGRISMVNHLFTLGHVNPTCPSNPIVHCRTGRISMVNPLCTLGMQILPVRPITLSTVRHIGFPW